MGEKRGRGRHVTSTMRTTTQGAWKRVDNSFTLIYVGSRSCVALGSMVPCLGWFWIAPTTGLRATPRTIARIEQGRALYA